MIDGDTVELHGTHIRLNGIDAPESHQTCKDAAGTDYRCGQKAALALSDEIGTGTLSCTVLGLDRYGRSISSCFVGDMDVNRWMVQQGWALAYRQYSTEYVLDEDAARERHAGVWQGAFTPPWEWRKQQRSPNVAQQPSLPLPPQSGCRIKGNINRKGEHIYHLPGGRDYERTVISTDRGERWFCSEDEAKSAGWRAPGS